MKRILITGVTGFIGSNIVRHFSGRDNVVLVGHSRDAAKARAQFKQSPVEIIELYSATTFDELKIDTIIHLAGIAHDLSGEYQTEDYYRVNCEHTKFIFDEFTKSTAKKFIYFSSIKAAVDTSSLPADESVMSVPVTDYGKSKRKAEEYIQSSDLAGSKKAFIVRPCMIHGQGNKGNLNLLYRYAKKGLPYPFGAFENQRSFLSIDNLNFIIQSFITNDDIPSGIFHLADDGFLSTKELYKLISEELGKTPRVLSLPAGMVKLLFSLAGKSAMLDKLTENMMVSNAKMSQYTSQPLPLGMRDGLRKTIRSFDGA